MSNKNSIGGILLVSGTSIGAGMLALPVATFELGFVYAGLIFSLSWFFMAISALYLLEANLAERSENINLASLAQNSLGTLGKAVAIFCYLVLLYALTAAYISGVSEWLLHKLYLFGNKFISFNKVAFLVASLLVFIAYNGTRGADYVNRLFAFALYVSLAVLFIFSLPETTLKFDNMANCRFSLQALPLIITSFGFHIVIPSLTKYFSRDQKKLTHIIIVGSIIPLLVYLTWEYIVLNLLSTEYLNLIFGSGNPATKITEGIYGVLNNKTIQVSCDLIAILSLITSIIGVTLGLYDFLVDTFKLNRGKKSNFAVLSLLVFVPPLFFTVSYPKGFIYILSFAGIAVAILLGILPILMVFSNRYLRKRKSSYRVYGDKPMLALSFFFFCSVIFIEILNQLHI